MESVNILEQVVWHLENTRVPMKRVALEAGVNRRYLYKLMSGETLNPQFIELNLVYQFFVNNPKARGKK